MKFKDPLRGANPRATKISRVKLAAEILNCSREFFKFLFHFGQPDVLLPYFRFIASLLLRWNKNAYVFARDFLSYYLLAGDADTAAIAIRAIKFYISIFAVVENQFANNGFIFIF